MVAADGPKVGEPVAIWKSQPLRCFENLWNKTRPTKVYHFTNEKAWMNSKIMETILKKLNQRMKSEGRNVILFLDNAQSNPEKIQAHLTKIKLIFLLKNTTFWLQELYSGIIKVFKCIYHKLLIREFKCNYQKLLIKFVISWINGRNKATEIINWFTANCLGANNRSNAYNIGSKNMFLKFKSPYVSIWMTISIPNSRSVS